VIEELARPAADADVRELAQLLLDAVASGASVGFLDSLSADDAAEWWRAKLASADPRAVFLVARDAEGIAGTVQLLPAAMPNQQHRADIAKLQVHRRARGQGLGRALMEAIEDRARAAGFTLLTLDTKLGDVAETLYERSGWTRVGVIPNYALDPDGSSCDTVIFYKQL
jgi:GNAT superfamily N-acetyltransferase